MSDLDIFATEIETTFNMFDAIPILGTFPAALRATMGKVQFCAGLTLGLLSIFGRMISPRSRDWQDLTSQSIKHAGHGILNVIRGAGEALASATIIGGLALLFFQSITNHFAPIVQYSSEAPPKYTPATPSVPIMYEC